MDDVNVHAGGFVFSSWLIVVAVWMMMMLLGYKGVDDVNVPAGVFFFFLWLMIVTGFFFFFLWLMMVTVSMMMLLRS